MLFKGCLENLPWVYFFFLCVVSFTVIIEACWTLCCQTQLQSEIQRQETLEKIMIFTDFYHYECESGEKHFLVFFKLLNPWQCTKKMSKLGIKNTFLGEHSKLSFSHSPHGAQVDSQVPPSWSHCIFINIWPFEYSLDFKWYGQTSQSDICWFSILKWTQLIFWMYNLHWQTWKFSCVQRQWHLCRNVVNVYIYIYLCVHNVKLFIDLSRLSFAISYYLKISSNMSCPIAGIVTH